MCILLDQEMTGEASTQGSDPDGTFGSVHRTKGSKHAQGLLILQTHQRDQLPGLPITRQASGQCLRQFQRLNEA